MVGKRAESFKVEGFRRELRVTWWIFIAVTSSVWLCDVVIEIRVDDGITGDSPPRWDWLPLRFCSFICAVFVTQSLPLLISSVAGILWPLPIFFIFPFSPFLLLTLALSAVSSSLLHDPLSHFPPALVLKPHPPIVRWSPVVIAFFSSIGPIRENGPLC